MPGFMDVILTLFTPAINILHIHGLPSGYKQSVLQVFIESLLFARPCCIQQDKSPRLRGIYILGEGANNNRIINYTEYQRVIKCYGKKAKVLAGGGGGEKVQCRR